METLSIQHITVDKHFLSVLKMATIVHEREKIATPNNRPTGVLFAEGFLLFFFPQVFEQLRILMLGEILFLTCVSNFFFFGTV